MALMLFALTLNSRASADLTLSDRVVLWNFSVWTRTVSVPVLVTTTLEPGFTVPTAALALASKLLKFVTEATWNSEPPRNSSPMLSPRPNRPAAARTRSTSDTVYQVFWRPTKSIERLPV